RQTREGGGEPYFGSQGPRFRGEDERAVPTNRIDSRSRQCEATLRRFCSSGWSGGRSGLPRNQLGCLSSCPARSRQSRRFRKAEIGDGGAGAAGETPDCL